MKLLRNWKTPYFGHAARVAVVATAIIGLTYVCVVVAFNGLDRHRLTAQVDTRINQRLDQFAENPSAAGTTARYANAHDADDAPVFLWQVGTTGIPIPLTPGAPSLSKFDASANTSAFSTQVGTRSFRFGARLISGRRYIAGQSLFEVDHVEHDLIALEILAGPILLVAVFLGTLLIGVKAASPVELARRRQLEFTADASHELRTPLSVIEAEVSLALKGTRSADEYRGVLTRVNRESHRLRTIVEDLLWLSRFDSQPLAPGDEPVDVSAIATACVDRFEPVALRRGITLTVSLEGGGRPWINAPPEWVDKLSAVLVDNACRYAGQYGEVRVGVFAQGNRVSLIVEDDGPGIPLEERLTLFDRFRRATDEGNGAGLGLAIGDAVVRATVGEWRIGDSRLGGARMEVRWHRSSGAKEDQESLDDGRRIPLSTV
jgi:signal transduction histidine kinase